MAHERAVDVLLKMLRVKRYSAERLQNELDGKQAALDEEHKYLDAYNDEAAAIADTLREVFNVKDPEKKADKLGDIWQVT